MPADDNKIERALHEDGIQVDFSKTIDSDPDVIDIDLTLPGLFDDLARLSDSLVPEEQPGGDSGYDKSPPPAYFVSLAVENVKCFGPGQELRLTDTDGRLHQWTVLIGENGVGKTTLLQCLAGMQPVASKNTSAGLNAIAYEEPTFRPVKGHRLLYDNEISCRAQTMKSRSIRSDKSRTDEWSVSFSPEAAVEFIVAFARAAERDFAGLICYGYGANRKMGKTALSDWQNQQTSISLFDNDVELVNPEEWLLQADYAAKRQEKPDSPQHRRLELVKSILIRLLPDVDDIRIVDTAPNSLPTVEAATPYGWVPIRHLSLGYQGMITWMVDFASRLIDRYPDSPDPLAEPAVALIDEIDLHLHPTWQRGLFEQLSAIFKNTQFIVTAHSPLVAQAAPGGNIVLLRREGDHVVLDYDFQSIHNWRVDQILTSDLFGLPTARPPQVDKALQERNAILGKVKLTAKDRQRLKELDEEVGELPGGQTLADAQAMDMIRKAAELIEASKGTAIDQD